MALPDSVLALSDDQMDRIVAMAWEDRTPFEAIFAQFGLRENEVRALMRNRMKASSFKMWRERVTGRKTKHAADLQEADQLRGDLSDFETLYGTQPQAGSIRQLLLGELLTDANLGDSGAESLGLLDLTERGHFHTRHKRRYVLLSQLNMPTMA